MSKVLSYRPDIDTLRAVAVLSVVVFHIEKTGCLAAFLVLISFLSFPASDHDDYPS